MPPKAAHSIPRHKDDASDSANSQDSATEMVTRLAQKMVNSTKKRRQTRRNELKADFLKASGRIEKSIDTSFGDPAKQAVKFRLEQLGQLLQRKAGIEERILAHTAVLEKAYVDAAQELSVVLQGRMQDIASMDNADVGHKK
ncbi:hypothetical protein MMC13_006670 [Lambiella insularis]|nr:hypothetical protein [Lambiella insularis]